MKKSLMRAAMVACLPFCAIALTVATAPAQAADKATAPSVSKSVAKQLGDCKKAYEAKDYATAIAKCTEAKNTPDTTDWDKYNGSTVVYRALPVEKMRAGWYADASCSRVTPRASSTR